MALDLRFDKVAAVYDAQRAHPPEVAEAIGRVVVGYAGLGTPVLELGIGTGRIAIPVAAEGARLWGLDLSAGMLATAAERAAAAGRRLTLVRGDAQQLPFVDWSFSAVLAVHVLHLLPDWRSALAEIARVVGPGGMLLQGSDWRDPESCVGLLRGQLRKAVMELQPGSRPPGAGAALVQALARLGGESDEPVIVASWMRALSPAAVLAGMAARFDAETWALPEELLENALARVRAWAEQQWPDLEQPEAVEHRFLLTVTRFAQQAR